MKTPFHSKNCSFQTLGGHTGNNAASALRFLMFLILCSVAISGCRKETDEFRRRPLSNGKVFIQIGGRKWMIDDSHPSFFRGDNTGFLTAPRGEYVTFDTLNVNLNKVVSFACDSKRKNGANIAARFDIYYKKNGNDWEINRVFGNVSSNPTNYDSIYYCSKIIKSSNTYSHRLNWGWHQGEIQFEGQNSDSTVQEIITIKYILKS